MKAIIQLGPRLWIVAEQSETIGDVPVFGVSTDWFPTKEKGHRWVRLSKAGETQVPLELVLSDTE